MQKLNKLTRGIVVLSLLAFVGVVGCSDSETVETGPTLVTLTIGVETPTVDLDAGMDSYMPCQGCHGAMGQGNTAPALNAFTPTSQISIGGVPDTLTFSRLQDKIELEMPPGSETSCEGTCAINVAGYIYCEWNSALVTSGCPAAP